MIYKIAVVTATRAEYGLLRYFMQLVKEDKELALQLVVTGTHFSKEFGSTYKDIEQDGFVITEKISWPHKSDSDSYIVQSTGLATVEMAKALERLKPDMVVMMGDRFELLALATACTIMRIPMAHISGGEITEGAFDNQIRHAVTKMAHLHFVANQVYAKRVRQMGEEDWRVNESGEPGLDSIHQIKFLSSQELKKDMGFDFTNPTALVTFHPTTLERDGVAHQVKELMQALKKAKLEYIMTYPNADPGYKVIRQEMDKFVATYSGKARAFANLGQHRYLSVLKYAKLMIGNSSSGIVEAPSFHLPVVNVGNRQKGRLCADNVIHTSYASGAIFKGMQQALTVRPKEKNPYGDGHSSKRIKEYIKKILKQKTRPEILTKKFRDYNHG